MTSSKHFTVQNIIALIILIVGIIWLIGAIVRYVNINSINSWPQTQAIILSSSIDSFNTNDSYGQQNISSNNLGNAFYTPRVQYQYNVNGKNIQSSKVYYGARKKFNGLDIQQIMQSLAPGTTILIRYNPKNYAESFIYNDPKSFYGIIWGILLILLALAIGFHHNVMSNDDLGLSDTESIVKPQNTKKTSTKTSNTKSSNNKSITTKVTNTKVANPNAMRQATAPVTQGTNTKSMRQSNLTASEYTSKNVATSGSANMFGPTTIPTAPIAPVVPELKSFVKKYNSIW